MIAAQGGRRVRGQVQVRRLPQPARRRRDAARAAVGGSQALLGGRAGGGRRDAHIAAAKQETAHAGLFRADHAVCAQAAEQHSGVADGVSEACRAQVWEPRLGPAVHLEGRGHGSAAEIWGCPRGPLSGPWVCLCVLVLCTWDVSPPCQGSDFVKGGGGVTWAN